ATSITATIQNQRKPILLSLPFHETNFDLILIPFSLGGDLLRNICGRGRGWAAFDDAVYQHNEKNREQCVETHEAEQRKQAVAAGNVFRITLRSTNQAINHPGLPADFSCHPSG